MRYVFKNVTPVRSATMRSIKGSNTKIEIKLRRAIFNSGFRYRIHYKRLSGSPDIVFSRQKVAVFCDSDFWHGRTLDQKRKTIKNNKAYWIKKIEQNIERDRKNNKELKQGGWKVLRFWETDINKNLPRILGTIVHLIK